eukprot:CAMPEP_0171309390 /NCGR_PEP_ID=MMETSP0816-20121228/19555_1 /TAXON_ID=420281 /ORGANISM="Proboscia inermis, Strain CCAP1064/1" /LENGTH=242 /DNA_ID=CAMNT_0011792895 /DNA_START=201 /DNA_END=929 /DNA_ORIENTATION=-
MTDGELRKMVLRTPDIISYSVDDNIKPTLRALKGYLQVSRAELRKLILKAPRTISLNFDCNIFPTLEAIKNYLNLDHDELRSIILRLPSVIGLSFDDNFKPTLDALQRRLGLSDEELKKIVVQMPSIINSSNTVLKLDWLQTAFNLNQTSLIQMVQKTPILLSVNLENTLVPGLIFWREVFNDLDDEDAIKEISSKMSELTQSNKRLLKRSQIFREKGISLELYWGKARYTDDRLEKWFGRQ